MADAGDRVACRTPEGKSLGTRIPRWKFDMLREAILAILSEAGAGGMLNKDLRDAVVARLSPESLAEMGKLGWHVVTVKLELEVRGEIRRLAGRGPIRIALAQNTP